MVKAIELYLVTNGNGLEAVDFYKNVFQAEVKSCTTFGQAMPNVSEEMKNGVLNAQLYIGNIRLQISDNNPEYPYQLGSQMSACVQVETVEEAKAIYDKLSVDAMRVELELQETPWSPAYSVLVDKFGMNWQINTDIEGFVSESVQF